MPTRQREKQRKMKQYRKRSLKGSPSAAALKRQEDRQRQNLMDPGSAVMAGELAQAQSDFKNSMKQFRAALKRMDSGSAVRAGESAQLDRDYARQMIDKRNRAAARKRMDPRSAVKNKGPGRNSGR